ncbi:24614_t:CDS:2, partial [Dentiscutata erythropus]
VLQHSDVKLTWDEDDPDRVRIVQRSFSNKDVEEMDFKTYLASSSEESDENDETSLQKYKNLVNELDNKDLNDDIDMEITFTPGLNENATETSTDKPIEDETTIEKYKRKQIEKRRERKAVKKANRSQTIKNEMSDSATDVLDDPFFVSSKKRKQKISNEERIEADRKRAELELLINVNDPRFAALNESHHFAIDPTSS